MNKEINQLIDQHLGIVFPGCIIGIGGLNKKDTIIARGTRDRIIPTMPSDFFDIASLTKAILHYGIISQIPEILDEPIMQWIPMTGRHREKITPRHLMAFGVEYGTPPLSKCTSKEEIMHYVLHGDLPQQPGLSFRYTNISSILLGMSVSAYMNISLENFFQEYIFNVLDMKDTSFTLPKRNYIPPEKICAHAIQDESAKLVGVNGSAGLVSTCADMLKFGKGVLSLPKEIHRALLQPVYPKPYNTFGLGFGLWKNNEEKLRDTRGEIPILRKNGFTGAHITIAPYHNLITVSLANICYPQRPDERIREIYRNFTHDIFRIGIETY